VFAFATTRLAIICFIQRIRDFSSRGISFYAAKADYALYGAVGPRIDTVGVWGSNPHAPTIPFNNLARITLIFRRSKTLQMWVQFLCHGLKTAAPIDGICPISLVTNVRLCSNVVAAKRPSITSFN